TAAAESQLSRLRGPGTHPDVAGGADGSGPHPRPGGDGIRTRLGDPMTDTPMTNSVLEDVRVTNAPSSCAPVAAAASAPMRTVLMYSQDTRGLGHITRTLTIAHHVLETFVNCVAYVVTRSKIARESFWPHRCDLIKLPSRRTPKTIQRTPEAEQ